MSVLTLSLSLTVLKQGVTYPLVVRIFPCVEKVLGGTGKKSDLGYFVCVNIWTLNQES